MNIALAGIVVLILLLPGILFYNRYFSEEFSKEYVVQDFFGLLFNTLVPSLLLYILIGIPVAYFLGYAYDFETLLGLLSSDKDILGKAIKNVEKFRAEIIGFLIGLSIFSAILGSLFKRLVIRRRLDALHPSLRFDNIWHYLITGKFFLMPRSQINLQNDSIEDVDITYVVALVNVSNTPILYQGALIDYELSKSGGLNVLYLKDAERKELSESDDQFQKINGHTLILKYENIINLNLTFLATDLVYNDNKELTSIDLRMIS